MDNWIVILVIVAISFFQWLFGEKGLKRMFESKEAPPLPAKDPENGRPPIRPPADSSARPLTAPASRWPESRPEMRPGPASSSPTSPASGRTAEEEKVRKFLEALGLPADAAPPSPVSERAPQRPVQTPPKSPPRLPVPPVLPVDPQPARPAAQPAARQSRADRAAQEAAKLPEAFVSPKEEVRREHEADIASSAAQRENQKRAYTKGMGQEIGVKKVGGTVRRGAAFRERLRNPGGLADAVLLAEILREPVGQRRY